jgi:hypothetical protein
MVALSSALLPTIGNAMGLGEITLLSRLGEKLVVEVSIISAPGEALDSGCFSLAPLNGADLPVVTAARPRLIRRGDTYVLQLTGSRPLNEPIFTIGLRVACGYDTGRDYVLMPEPPLILAETSTMPPDSPTGDSGISGAWPTRSGDGLTDASPRASATSSLRQRPRTPLKPTPAPTVARSARGEGMAMALSPRKTRVTQSAPAPASGNDKLVLGAAGEPEMPAPKGRAAPASASDAEERMLKLETTLHLLTQEVEKMDQALALATKAIEAQNKLQQAGSLQPAQAPGVAALPSTLAPASNTSANNWLELVLSAALGAGISVGFAQYLGRRRRFPGEDQQPLAFTGYHPEVTPVAPQKEPPAEPGVATSDNTVFSNIDGQFPVPSDPEAIQLREDDERSMLDLAEVMLSFGRVRGATDTLAEYIEQNLPASISPWRMLLDLYRRGGEQAAFESLATRMRARFNANIPPWDELTQPISGLKTLEDFPHVLQKAGETWGSQTCFDYLHGLTHDTRAGQRSGFPLEVVEEIALLMQILESAYKVKRTS